MALVTGALLLGSAGLGLWSKYSASKDRENVLRYNSAVALQKSKAASNAAELNQDIRQEQSRRKLAKMKLNLSNRGVEMTGSPLLMLTNEVADQQADFTEAYRQAEIMRIEGHTESAMLERSADIESNNRMLSLIGGAAGMAGQGMSSMSKAPTNKSLLADANKSSYTKDTYSGTHYNK